MIDFGFTNDEKRLTAAHVYREICIQNGWTASSMYGTHESIERAAKLMKDGFVTQIISREHTKLQKSKYEVSISIWGPDRLALPSPEYMVFDKYGTFIYDFDRIKKCTRICNYCGTQNVETARVGFAGRACLSCQPKEEAKLPKWFYD